MPAAMIAVSPSAMPKATAEAAEPARKTDSVVRRPHTSISQAATVFELAGVDETLTVRQLFGTAMRVGRDHIASMVYTLVLAYAGASLPLLLIFSVSQRSLGEVLTSDIVAVELVRSIVGAIAVVLAVPLTTLVAALLTKGTDSAVLAAGPSHHH